MGELAARRWRVRPSRDVPITMIAAAMTMSVLVEVAPPACLPSCEVPAMNALDRLAIGGFAGEPLLVANVLLVILGVALLGLHWRHDRGAGFWPGVLVFVQTILVVQALVQLTKFAVDRAAPFVYVAGTPAEALASKDAARSFISGHTASAFVVGTLVIVVLWLRWPRSATRDALMGVTAAMAMAVGPFKIAAGYHYWTDIIAGALVGTAVGVLVPLAHLRGARRGQRDQRSDGSRDR
jgi:membrane-associated phospholipid phosphatase